MLSSDVWEKNIWRIISSTLLFSNKQKRQTKVWKANFASLLLLEDKEQKMWNKVNMKTKKMQKIGGVTAEMLAHKFEP